MNGFEMILPFLKPIEHLILDDSISEVMVNGPAESLSKGTDSFEEVHGVSLGEKSLMVAVRTSRADLATIFGSETDPRFAAARRKSGCCRYSSVQPERSHTTIRKFNSRHFDIDDLSEPGP